MNSSTSEFFVVPAAIYPWGSGDNPYQRSESFKGFIDKLSKEGLSHKQIADFINETYNIPEFERLSSKNLREAITISGEVMKNEDIKRARELRDREYSHKKIAELMSNDSRTLNESTVRGWLKKSEDAKADSALAIAEVLMREADEKRYLDVGVGNHLRMGDISYVKFNTAVTAAKDQGYNVYSIKELQPGTGETTRLKVLTPPDVDYKEFAQNRGKLQLIGTYIDHDTQEFKTPSAEPVSINSKRIQVRYGEDGGGKMDGVIELRQGVEDLSLGNDRYSQVRIAVDKSHYLKGMAIYADDLPPGIDIRFNTPKSKSEGKLEVMKPLKDDESNRFGATTIPPRVYKDKNGKDQTSAINKVYEEGDWDKWSTTASSQFLSKQPVSLARKQLKEAHDIEVAKFNEIKALTNPIVKQKLLLEFAEGADSAAVHLKAAAFKGQSNKVLLPMNSMRPGEVFAPGMKNGDKVVLVRHPHAGRFEIPELTVNNLNRTAQKLMGGARDAVGIHPSVAAKLSGADFDGDSVVVIPNNSRAVKTKDTSSGPLADLKNFEPKEVYKIADDDTTTRRMTKSDTQKQMGQVSNLITDMTIRGANDKDIAAAVRHSMVVIDAEKHGLDYKRSEKDNRIAELKKAYQIDSRGASTIISRAKGRLDVPDFRAARKNEGGPIDPETGKLNFVPTGKQKAVYTVDKETGVRTYTGETTDLTKKVRKMAWTDDARTLLSSDPTEMELVYANHANSMKALANEARKVAVNTPTEKKSNAAASLYSKEVNSLKAKLKVAQSNAPLERQAITLANELTRRRTTSDTTSDEAKKIKFQSLNVARQITGASKQRIGGSKENDITPREWEAIQSRAIGPDTLRKIMANADMDRIKSLATPKPTTTLTTGQQARIRQLAAMNRTPTEIAEALGIPRSTVTSNLDKS